MFSDFAVQASWAQWREDVTARKPRTGSGFALVRSLYHAQEQMFTGQPHAVMLNIAKSAGLTDAQFEACIRDDKALLALNQRVEGYSKNQKINSTPTFVINGKVYEGEQPMEKLDAAIAAAQAAAGKPAS